MKKMLDSDWLSAVQISGQQVFFFSSNLVGRIFFSLLNALQGIFFSLLISLQDFCFPQKSVVFTFRECIYIYIVVIAVIVLMHLSAAIPGGRPRRNTGE